MLKSRPLARRASTLCCAWPFLFFQLPQPPAPVPDEEPLVLPGVVLEEIPEDSALKRAGLEPGDVVLRWERLPNPPANPEGASGVIESPFDWMWLEIEQAPRGVVRLWGERGGERRQWETKGLGWGVLVTPRAASATDGLSAAKILASLGKAESEYPEAAPSRKPPLHELECWAVFRVGVSQPLEAEKRLAEILSSSDRRALRGPLLPETLAYGLLRLVGQAPSEAEGPANSASGSLERKGRKCTFYLARLFDGLGSEALYRGEVQTARPLLMRGLALDRAISGPLAVAQALNSAGGIEVQLGNFVAARGAFTQGLELRALHAPGSRGHAESLGNLGQLEMLEGQLEEAQSLLQQSVDLFERAEDFGVSYLGVLAAAGTVKQQKYDLAGARADLEAAVRNWRLIPGYESSKAAILHNLANVYRDLGELDLAEESARGAVSLLKSASPDRTLEAHALRNLATVLHERHELAETELVLREALEIYRETTTRSTYFADCLNSLGSNLLEQNRLDEARGTLASAIQLYEELSPGSLDLAAALGNLARVEIVLGRLPAASALLERARSIEVTLASETLRLAQTIHAQADVREKMGDVARAAMDFAHALEIKKRVVPGSESYSKTLARVALLHVRLGDLLGAEGLLEQAVDALQEHSERVRRKLGSRERVLGQNAEIFRALVTVQLRARHSRAAFASSERFHGEVFRSQLSGTSFTVSAVVGRHASPDEVSRALDAGTLTLSYLLGEAETYTFALSAMESLRTHTLLIPESTLRQKVERFRQLLPEARPGTALGDFKLAELRQLGKELYNLLLAPAADQIEKAERVMIVADGPLHYLPFAALTREVVDENGVKRDQYLAEWKPFHSVLSATVFAELKKDRRDPTKPDDGTALQLVAFGDPQFPASVSPNEPDKIADIRVRSAARRGALELAPLPYTRREVEGIAALFPPDRVQTFLGAEATEEKAKAVGKGARILHFATHAKLDDRFPLNSSLLLSMPEGFPEDRENGLLQVWEIFERVRLDADLVVLSACESGLGEEQGGEGLIGLTRAFQYAGARTVLASLWEVRDEATAELMIRFYRHLTAGKPKDQALQAAQRELLSGPIEIPGPDGKPQPFDATAPYYWAAFQVIGDWQ